MKKRKTTPRKVLFEVATRWTGRESKYTCVLASSKGAAIRLALGPSLKVVSAEPNLTIIGGKFVVGEDRSYWVTAEGGSGPLDVDVRRGCACVKGSL